MRHTKRVWRTVKKPLHTRRDELPDNNCETTPNHYPQSFDGSQDRHHSAIFQHLHGPGETTENVPARLEGSLIQPSGASPVEDHDHDPHENNDTEQRYTGEDYITANREPSTSVTGKNNTAAVHGRHSNLTTNSLLPCHSTGLIPHIYQQVLAKRFRYDRFDSDGDLNIKKSRPIFLHDTLMFPGSLATMLGRSSGSDLLHYLTPARLPSFHAYIHATSSMPILLKSSAPSSSVHGILVLGASKRIRRSIGRHYQPKMRRVTADVFFEVCVPVPSEERQSSGDKWKIERRTAGAHVFLWADASSTDAMAQSVTGGEWRIEDFTQAIDDGSINVVQPNDPCWQMKSIPPRNEGEDERRGESRLRIVSGENDWFSSPVFGDTRKGPPESVDGFCGW